MSDTKQMSEGKHTPLPWRYSRGNIVAGDSVETPRGMSQKVICAMHGKLMPDCKANASLIVNAVNTHAALLEALKEAADGLVCEQEAPAFCFTVKGCECGGCKTYRESHAAITQAEKGVRG